MVPMSQDIDARRNAPHFMLKRFPYEEPHVLNLVLSAGNGNLAGKLEFYCNASDLADLGMKLSEFPKAPGDHCTYERGSRLPEHRFAYHLRLHAYTSDSVGHCGLQIAMSNNGCGPAEESCSFSILAEAAALNRLGRLLNTFSGLNHSELHWYVSDGHLL